MSAIEFVWHFIVYVFKENKTYTELYFTYQSSLNDIESIVSSFYKDQKKKTIKDYAVLENDIRNVINLFIKESVLFIDKQIKTNTNFFIIKENIRIREYLESIDLSKSKYTDCVKLKDVVYKTNQTKIIKTISFIKEFLKINELIKTDSRGLNY